MSYARKTVLVLIIFFGGCAYYNTMFNAKGSYNDGIEAIRESVDQNRMPANAKKYFETTIEKCWKLIDIYSDKSKWADDALLYISKSEFHLEKYAQAKLHLEQFMQKYANSDLLPEAHLWYAKVLLKEEDVETANEYFRKVINKSKAAQIRSQASFELGLYAFEKKNYAQAIELLGKALKEKLEDEYKASVLFFLAEAYYTQGNYKEAAKQYKKVVKFHPTLDVEYKAELHLAKSYAALENYEEANRILRKMLTAPRFKNFESAIKTAIAENYERQGDLTSALEMYNEVVHDNKRNVGTAQAAFNLAKIYETTLTNLDSAVNYYGKVGKIFPKFDSVEVAKRKERTLNELKNIRVGIKNDERLVSRLTNEPSFRDSLYQAQREDSLKRASGIVTTEPQEQTTPQDLTSADSSLFNPFENLSKADSLKKAREDSLKNLAVNKPKDPAVDQQNEEEESYIGFRDRPEKEAGDGVNVENKNKINPKGPDTNQQVKKKPLEKRKLPQIEFDLMNHRFQLAEYYLLKEQNYDSAAHYYEKFIQSYEDSILTPKALYSLIFVYRSPHKTNPEKLYNYEKELMVNYKDSPFAINLMENKGMLDLKKKEVSREEEAYREFLKAESLYFAGDYRRAIVEYQKVADLDSTLDVSAKAQFAVGWIYEKDLSMIDSAYGAYKRVVERFPKALSYVAIARKKIQPPPEETAASDTALLAANAETVDSILPNGEKGDLDEAKNDIEAAFRTGDLLKAKIRWRNRREAR